MNIITGFLRDMGILSRIIPLLQHSNVKLLTRAVGVGLLVLACARYRLLITRLLRRLCTTCRATAAALPVFVTSRRCPCSFICSRWSTTQIHQLSIYFCLQQQSFGLTPWRAGSTARHLRQCSRHASEYVKGTSLLRYHQVHTISPRRLPALLVFVHSLECFHHFCDYHLVRTLLTLPSRCSGIEPLIDLLFGSDIASQVLALLFHLTFVAFSHTAGMRKRRSIELHRPVGIAGIRASAQAGVEEGQHVVEGCMGGACSSCAECKADSCCRSSC